MEQKKKAILEMVENGTLTADEAIVLLRNLATDEETAAPVVTEPKEQKQQEEPTAEEQEANDFFEDVKKDFSYLGNQMMKFVQTAVDQVKKADFQSPFGEKTTFERTYPIEVSHLQRVYAEGLNGGIQVKAHDSQDVSVHAKVSFYLDVDEETAVERFEKEFVHTVDGDTLIVESETLRGRVDLTIFVPQSQLDKVTVVSKNGQVAVEGVNTRQLKVETANGKIHCVGNTFEDAKLKTLNGKIYVKNVTGNEIEASALNGTVYLEGHLNEIEAETTNGTISITTTDETARKIEAESFAGGIELFIPKQMAFNGHLETNMGSIQVDVADATVMQEDDHLFKRSTTVQRFEQDQRHTTIKAQTNTGTISFRETLA